MNNPEGKRLIPEKLLRYLEALKKNHNDPSEEWGSSGGSNLEDIVDSAGNKRFIEGAINTSISNINNNYKGWSLSGTHLMIVLSFSVLLNINLSEGQKIASVDIPSWVKQKIRTAYLTTVDKKVFNNYAGNDTFNVELYKSGQEIEIHSAETKTLAEGSIFRIQFDLLIDDNYS